jgi:uncharacterized protein
MEKKKQIKEIISDFHQKQLPDFVQREFREKTLPNKVFSIMGVRRSGKTFCFYQLIKEILAENNSIQSILFVNFEDDRLYPVNKSILPEILNAYYELYPDKKNSTVYIFFDEIQNIEGWEKFVRRLLDTENVRIYITGSSSKMLSKELSTSLRGRTIAREIFPLNFTEYLRFHDVAPVVKSSRQRAQVTHLFEAYLNKGGFPEVMGLGERERVDILQEYINLIIYKDLIERHNIKNISLIKYLIHYFLTNLSNLFSINKLFNDLKSQGYKVSKDALFNYVSYLEDAYCFFSVPIFSASLKTRQVNPRKIYAVDHGLATASVWKLSEDYGRLLENIVFIHLRRVSPWRGIYYYLTDKEKEVDFVVTDKNKVITLIQVCYSLDSKASKEREVKALSQAMEELKVKQGLILTYSEEETIKLGKKKVIVKPVWEWALGKMRE